MRHHLRRLLPLAALLTMVVVSPAAHLVNAQPVAQAPSPHTETIHAAFDLLMDQFYRVPDPGGLLDAAWNGVVGELESSGVRGAAPARPDFGRGRAAAWQAFAAAYPALAGLSPPDLSQTDLAFAAIEAMAGSLHERHTTFLDPESYRDFTTSLGGAAEDTGLGILITARAPWLVTEVLPDTPAERGGVRPGDTILAVDGRDVTAVARAALAQRLDRGLGATVELVVDRPNAGHLVLDVTIGRFVVPDIESRVLPGGVGLIRLRQFSTFITTPGGPPNVLEALDAALERFEAAGATAWVLDLRDNPGGSGFTADELLGRFLPDAVDAIVSNQRGKRGEEATSGQPFRVQRPMAVLVNGGSASASEIVAGAVQEYGRATVVGTRTSGALADAFPFPLPDGAALYVALAEVRTGRRGAVVDGVGVSPDITLEDRRTAADYAAGRDPQLEAAVSAIRGLPALAPPPLPPPGQLSVPALRTLLTRYLPAAEDAPATPLIPAPRTLGELGLDVPNQFVKQLGPVADTAGLAAAVRGRGWQGSYSRFFGQAPGLTGPNLGVTIDLYTSQAGAYLALNSNDAPLVLDSAPVPAQVGDGAVAYVGTWESAGSTMLVFRSGRAVVTVSYVAVPGQESFEPILALARAVEARLRITPIPELEPAPP